MTFQLVSKWFSFGGQLSVHDHQSVATGTPMRFAIFEPPQVKSGPVPVIWYLSGLTCTWANVMEKSGIMAYAAHHGVAIVAPDTSPRGPSVPDEDSYDLGQGAGFYLTATQEPWKQHFAMDAYLLNDLSSLVSEEFHVDMQRQGIMGHSMGGHGALTLHLKNQSRFRSCSALAPILSPSQVPWGKKALQAYLGENINTWEQYDASELVLKSSSKATILVDQGRDDPFYEEQLDPKVFLDACERSGQKINYQLHDGYDHSYYFVASMIGKHIAHHAQALSGNILES